MQQLWRASFGDDRDAFAAPLHRGQAGRREEGPDGIANALLIVTGLGLAGLGIGLAASSSGGGGPTSVDRLGPDGTP